MQRLGNNPSVSGVLKKALVPTGPIIEEFRPMTESLDWRLGQRYWSRLGCRAFAATDGVPFRVNNNGDLSKGCAEFFFKNLKEQEALGEMARDLFVLELGVGIGLFARLFLDWFRELCLAGEKDYYERLTYIAADMHAKILQDLCRNGTFSDHPGHYLLRLADATRPVAALMDDTAFADCGGRPLDAVFLNYVLDCLPATILQIDTDCTRTICVRTRLTDCKEEFREAGADPAELLRLSRSENPRDLDQLSGFISLLRFEYDFFPITTRFPYQEAAIAFARSRNLRHVVHNYGAIESLDGLSKLLKDRGFIFVSDYDYFQWNVNEQGINFEERSGRKLADRDMPEKSQEPTDRSTTWNVSSPRPTTPGPGHCFWPVAGLHEAYQTFAGARAIGINFSLLKDYFGQGEVLGVLDLETECIGISTMAFHRGVGCAVSDTVRECLGGRVRRDAETALRLAQASMRAQHFADAAFEYDTLIRNHPNNWVILHEAARLLLDGLNRRAESLTFVKAALRLNPFGSPSLWNSLGDVLRSLRRYHESLSAYSRAIRIDSVNVESRVKLAMAHAAMSNWTDALRQIAEGLALDSSGAYRETLLRLQTNGLSQADRHHARDKMRTRPASRFFTIDHPSGQVAQPESDGRKAAL